MPLAAAAKLSRMPSAKIVTSWSVPLTPHSARGIGRRRKWYSASAAVNSTHGNGKLLVEGAAPAAISPAVVAIAITASIAQLNAIAAR